MTADADNKRFSRLFKTIQNNPNTLVITNENRIVRNIQPCPLCVGYD